MTAVLHTRGSFWAFVLAAMLTALPCRAAIAFVSAATGETSSTAIPTTTATYTITAGNLVVVKAYQQTNTTATVSSVTDTAGSTYVQGTSCRVAFSGSTGTIDIWYTKNAVGGSNQVVTVNWNGTVSGATTALQYSGADTTAPFDNCVTNTGANPATTISQTITTAGTGEVIVAMACCRGGGTGWTAGTSYTLRATEDTQGFGHQEDRLNAPSGASSAAISNDGTGADMEISVAAFKPPGGAAPTPCWRLLLGVGCHD
jgi:hypothetical protein